MPDYGETTSKQFVIGLKKFKVFMKENPTIILNISKPTIHNNLFNNKGICFTGFRNKDLEETIKKNNGRVVNTISKDLLCLVCKNKVVNNNKIELAKSYNITLYSLDEFKDKYNLN